MPTGSPLRGQRGRRPGRAELRDERRQVVEPESS
jgi:hypothetical protein